jgi:AcrR family transcriptional regulator
MRLTNVSLNPCITMSSDRKSAILDAACRVIGRDGADRMRVSDVGREAGISTALVHYYFPTRADLVSAAFAFADDRADATVEAEAEGAADGRQRLTRLLCAWASLDDDVHRSWAIWSEMWRHAMYEPRTREATVASYRRWLDQIEAVLVAGAEDGSLPAGSAHPAVARRLVALVDGLGQQMLIGMLSPAQMRELVADAIEVEAGRTPAGEIA